MANVLEPRLDSYSLVESGGKRKPIIRREVSGFIWIRMRKKGESREQSGQRVPWALFYFVTKSGQCKWRLALL